MIQIDVSSTPEVSVGPFYLPPSFFSALSPGRPGPTVDPVDGFAGSI